MSNAVKLSAALLASPFAMLAGCSETPGEITRDTEPFDAIGEQTSVSMVGTEPFWNLSVEPADGGYRGTFETPENIEGTTFRMVRFAGNNGIGFSGEMEGRIFQAAVTPGECSDGMSDRTYPYTATVVVGDETLYGCAYTDAQSYTGSEAP